MVTYSLPVPSPEALIFVKIYVAHKFYLVLYAIIIVGGVNTPAVLPPQQKA